MINVNGLEIHWGDERNDGTFGSGEIKAKIPNNLGMKNVILYHWNPRGDQLMTLGWLMKCIRDLYPGSDNTLIMDYVPNGRLDKPLGTDILDGHLLAPLNQYMAETINAMNFTKVIGVEPHSKDFFKQYKNATAEYPTMRALEMIGRIAGYKQNYQVIFPDYGSFERYKDLISAKERYSDYVIFEKKRVNGKIETLDIAEGKLVDNKKKIIIDDICGTGGTILKTAKLINKMCEKKQDIKVLVAFLEHTVQNANEDDENWVLSEKSPVSQIIVCGPLIFEPVFHRKVTYLHYNCFKEERIAPETVATLF